MYKNLCNAKDPFRPPAARVNKAAYCSIGFRSCIGLKHENRLGNCGCHVLWATSLMSRLFSQPQCHDLCKNATQCS